MVWRPFMGQMREIVQTRSILGTRVQQWMAGTAERICAKFTRRHIWYFARMSLNVKVKSQRSRSPGSKNALCTHNTPAVYGRNGTPSLPITSRKQQARRFERCRGVYSPGCVRRAWRTTAGLYHAFLVGTHPHVRHFDGFSYMMAQTARNRARMRLLWFR